MRDRRDALALTGFQRALLRVLARNRSPNSVFAGDATQNRRRARWSPAVLAFESGLRRLCQDWCQQV